MIIMAFATADGAVEQRALALTVEDAMITRVVYYQLAVSRPSERASG
jgi:hypothetical protein